MAPGHLQQQQELLKQPQMMLQGAPSHCEGVAHPCHSTMGRAQPQGTSRLTDTLLACISTTFLTEAQAGRSEAKLQSSKNFFFQDHSHLTYALEKGFLAAHGLRAQAPLSTTLPAPRNSPPGPRSSWPLVTHPHGRDFCSSSCTVLSQRQALHSCLGLTC